MPAISMMISSACSEPTTPTSAPRIPASAQVGSSPPAAARGTGSGGRIELPVGTALMRLQGSQRPVELADPPPPPAASVRRSRHRRRHSGWRSCPSSRPRCRSARSAPRRSPRSAGRDAARPPHAGSAAPPRRRRFSTFGRPMAAVSWITCRCSWRATPRRRLRCRWCPRPPRQDTG